MAEILRMPEVAANALEAVLQDWPVPENTPYAASDTIATVETEKAVVDVEAESGGIILKTLIPAGSEVRVGAPIAVLGEVGETIDDVDALLASLGVARVEPTEAADRREVPNEVPNELPTADPALDRGAAAPAEPADVPAPSTPPAPPPATPAPRSDGTRIFASPLARKLAREAGLEVETITGTGPGGRIVRRDVEAAVRRTPAPAAAVEPAAPERPVTPQPAPVSAVAADEVPHSRMRSAIASRLTESKQTIPHFYVRGSAQVDALLELRRELNAAGGVKISVNDLVVKAVARAHLMVPAVNVIWTTSAMKAMRSVDVSVAIATERGLVTPVLRGVEAMTVSTVAATVQDFVARAQTGRLRQDELEGGAVSVSNLGMYGTEEFAAIINPPQSAILAVGAAREEAVVRRGKVKVATVMRVTLSADHRAIDGAVAAEWMKAFVAVVEAPLQILA